ncbi:MAG: hypothetical protein OEX81_05555 [Candidatus Pacebacteria bacterium]|nr:hypothetical protein [Candidatus Paceibacterota bacterium]
MAANSIIFYIIFSVLFILGQLQRIELGFFPPFYLHDFILFLWLLTILITNWKKALKLVKSINFSKYRLEILFLLWVVIGWLVAFIMGDLGSKFVFYTLRFVCYGLLFYFVSKFKLIKNIFLKWGFYLTGFYILLTGLFQYVFLPDMRFLSILGWDDHYFRLIGTQFDPNFIGIILVLLFINFSQLKIKNRLLIKNFFLFVILIGLALTFSRSSYLSFTVALLLLAKLNPKKYLSGIMLLILIIFAPKPGGEGVNLIRTASISARVETSQKTVTSLKPYQYIVGRGLFNQNKSSYLNKDYFRSDHALLEDNFILLIFNSTGIVGLALVSFLLGKHLLQLYKKDQVGVISILAVLTHAMFNNSVFQPFVFIYLTWSLISKVDSKFKF